MNTTALADVCAPPGFVLNVNHRKWEEPADRIINRILSCSLPPNISLPAGCIAVDPHVHSYFSGCSMSTAEGVILRAVSMGLSAIAIVDHNDIQGAKLAVLRSEEMKLQGLIPEGFLVIPGAEISTARGHVSGLFIEEDIPDHLSPGETIDIIHDAGGIAVANHPYHSSGVGDLVFDLPFDAVETESGVTFGRWAVERGRSLVSEARLAGLGKLGASDAHYVNAIGNCYTILETDEVSLDAIRCAIIGGRTKAVVSRTCERLRRMLGWASKLQ